MRSRSAYCSRPETDATASTPCTVEREPVVGAEATVRSDSSTWTDVLLHGLAADVAITDGRMTVEGDRAALDSVVAAFPLLSHS